MCVIYDVLDIIWNHIVSDFLLKIKKLLEFFELHPYPDFLNNLQKLGDMNQKWKENLKKEELEIISNTLSETVKRFNLPYDLEKVKYKK